MAEKKGFSSLQDVMRLFIAQFVENKIDVGFIEPSERLSPRAARRYDKMVDGIESGKIKTKVRGLRVCPIRPSKANC